MLEPQVRMLPQSSRVHWLSSGYCLCAVSQVSSVSFRFWFQPIAQKIMAESGLLTPLLGVNMCVCVHTKCFGLGSHLVCIPASHPVFPDQKMNPLLKMNVPRSLIKLKKMWLRINKTHSGVILCHFNSHNLISSKCRQLSQKFQKEIEPVIQYICR